MDRVNYIINRYYKDLAYPNAQGEELQAAIWHLVCDTASSIISNLITWHSQVVSTILTDSEDGDGYVAGDCDYKILLLDMLCHRAVTGPNHQTTLLFLPPECDVTGDETIWACGTGFPGHSWAMYMTYCVQ